MFLMMLFVPLGKLFEDLFLSATEKHSMLLHGSVEWQFGSLV